jgi:hypothetical protein
MRTHRRRHTVARMIKRTGGDRMSFLSRPVTTLYPAERARALAAWRVAARRVSVLWDGVLVAERQARDDAFAAYLAALDAEAAAADELAHLHLREAA